MAVVRGIFAVLIGVIAAAVIGGAYDYLKLSFIPNPDEWSFIWPYVFAASGAIASVIAVVLYARWSRPPDTERKKASRVSLGQPIKAKPAGKDKSGIGTSSEVPGMPTFDVDKLKAEGTKKEQKK
jgi:hypothetical protein